MVFAQRRRPRASRPRRSTSRKPSGNASRSPTPRSRSSRATPWRSRSTTAAPMDIEWGKDGDDGKLYVLQARPETVKSRKPATSRSAIALKGSSARRWSTGRAIGQKIGSGTVRVVQDAVADGPRASRATCSSTDMTDPELGAGDEARRGDRHQPRRPHLPRRDHRARARHSGGRRLRRRDRQAEGRPGGHGVVRRRRHRPRLSTACWTFEVVEPRARRDAAHRR